MCVCMRMRLGLAQPFKSILECFRKAMPPADRINKQRRDKA